MSLDIVWMAITTQLLDPCLEKKKKKKEMGKEKEGDLGHKFCLQLHLCRPFECNIHQ